MICQGFGVRFVFRSVEPRQAPDDHELVADGKIRWPATVGPGFSELPGRLRERRGSGASEITGGELEPSAAEGIGPWIERTNADDDLRKARFAIRCHQRLPIAPIAIFQHAPDDPRGVAFGIHPLSLHIPKQVFGQAIHATKQAWTCSQCNPGTVARCISLHPGPCSDHHGLGAAFVGLKTAAGRMPGVGPARRAPRERPARSAATPPPGSATGKGGGSWVRRGQGCHAFLQGVLNFRIPIKLNETMAGIGFNDTTFFQYIAPLQHGKWLGSIKPEHLIPGSPSG